MTIQNSEAEQLEQIPVQIFKDADAASTSLAREIKELILTRQAEGKQVVLGLATGSTPVRLYRELIRMHNEEGLSFKNVITFNLDEYYGLEDDHPESYHKFMADQLFDHIDIPVENINIPDGTVERSEVFSSCRAYEEAIEKAGGIDLQILGIGRTGHIGFNEPGAGRESRTRLVTLDDLTRKDAARDFLGEENVPRYAITMGVGTIRNARKVILMAWGESKAGVIAKAVEESPTETLPASFLQGHPAVRFLVDEAAASELTRKRRPWLVGQIEWTPAVTRKAVQWLSLTVNKPILKLLDAHYNEHGMADLLTLEGNAYDLNIRIFNETQHTITGWPGGKANADDSHRPERAIPFPKRVLVLSPEPQDDVLYMGGTLSRLVQQGHEVTIAYLTSGNLAVSDSQIRRGLEFIESICGDFSHSPLGGAGQLITTVIDQLNQKGRFELDTTELRQVKGLWRRSEAWAGLECCGIQKNQVRFLDLPFYENGRYRRFTATQDDIKIISSLLDEVKPHQIFLTGNRADPSSLHAISYAVFEQAYHALGNASWKADCYLWLYRGQGSEWEVNEADMAVPLSPGELATKIQAIYQHQSQRSQSPAGGDHREAWQQIEAMNRETARTYDRLGLADYEAIELYQRKKMPAGDSRS